MLISLCLFSVFFQAGRFDGNGKFTYAGGSEWNGLWRHGEPSGIGTWNLPPKHPNEKGARWLPMRAEGPKAAERENQPRAPPQYREQAEVEDNVSPRPACCIGYLSTH